MRVGDRGRQPASPQAPGASVKFTATATGCPNPNYQFWLQPPGGAWSIVQAYSTSNSWTWNTSGLAAGTYTLDVYTRDASSAASFDAHISPNPTLHAPGRQRLHVRHRNRRACLTATTGHEREVHRDCGRLPDSDLPVLAPGAGGLVVGRAGIQHEQHLDVEHVRPRGRTYLLDVYARQSGSTATYEAHISPNPTYRIAPGWNGTDAPGVSAATRSSAACRRTPQAPSVHRTTWRSSTRRSPSTTATST